MKFLRRNWQKAVAVVLAVATFTASMYFSPINVQAEEKTYISEVFVSIADTEREAKDYLMNAGYYVIDSNLCEGMSWGAVICTKPIVLTWASKPPMIPWKPSQIWLSWI